MKPSCIVISVGTRYFFLNSFFPNPHSPLKVIFQLPRGISVLYSLSHHSTFYYCLGPVHYVDMSEKRSRSICSLHKRRHIPRLESLCHRLPRRYFIPPPWNVWLWLQWRRRYNWPKKFIKYPSRQVFPTKPHGHPMMDRWQWLANTLEMLLNIGFDIEFKIPFQSRRQLTLFDDSMMMMDRIELGIRIRNHQMFNQNKS